ncbi:MAG: hypothetical protein JWM50_1845 [Microbacteriaceae bacterium]|nr:hypothetical protein [Microbacteriaceae bacterium]
MIHAMRPITTTVHLALAALIGAGCGDSSPTTDAGASTDRSARATRAARVEGEFHVTYRATKSGEPRRIRRSGVVERSVDAINAKVRLPRDVEIVMGGDDDGPYYDPERQTVEYPWTFVTETRSLLRSSDYAGAELDAGVEDAVGYILQHEMGHALIDQLALPVLGKEEDAADSFASFVAVNWLDDGEQVIAASDLFGAYDDEAGTTTSESEFFDSHSLDRQRFYTTSCQVYGADPKRYDNVVDGLDIDDERLEECRTDWDELDRSWKQELRPYRVG